MAIVAITMDALVDSCRELEFVQLLGNQFELIDNFCITCANIFRMLLCSQNALTSMYMIF